MIPRHISMPFYKSARWKKCRAGYIKSVGGLCERCLIDNKIVKGYIVHHIKYITPSNIDDPDITLNWENLEFCCIDCHNKEHFGKDTVIRDDVTFDKEGNLIRKSD